MTMETSSPLAVESFSHSWLSTVEPSLEVKSKSFSTEAHENFNFEIPVTQASYALPHADELFSDGLIRPLFSGPPDFSTALTPAASASSLSSRNVIPALRGQYDNLICQWRNSIKKVLLKCFGYLRSSRRKCRSRVDDIDKGEREVNNKSLSNSPRESPKSSSPGDWCDIENSIYEAILHCKRTIEK